jgi:hypothetical protein
MLNFHLFSFQNMLDQKCILRASMLDDLKQGKSATDSGHTLCQAFGKDVIPSIFFKFWFPRFKPGNESLKDEEGVHRPDISDNKLSRAAIEMDPR